MWLVEDAVVMNKTFEIYGVWKEENQEHTNLETTT